MRRRMMMQTEGDENMKDYKLIKTIHLAEDAQGISFHSMNPMMNYIL